MGIFKIASAAMFEIQWHAIKWAIAVPPILMKIGTQTKKKC
jgi:hypothetical protein